MSPYTNKPSAPHVQLGVSEKNRQKDYSHLFEEQDSNIKTNKVTNIAEKQLEKSAIHYKDKNDLSLENHKIVDEIEEKELKENQTL